MGFPGRDAKIQVATSPTATHVATSKMMSRPQISSTPSLLRRDTIFPCRDLPCCHPCRDLKIDVATSSRNMDFPVTTKDSLLQTSARSRHQKGCRDTNSSSLSRDAKTMSRPHLVWPRSCVRCLGRGRNSAVMRAAARATTLALRTCCLPVTTSTPGRAPVLEIGSSHSSFCLARKKFFFFSKL